MADIEYRIVEKTYHDGVKYQVQMRAEGRNIVDPEGIWRGLVQVKTLQEARDVITERKNKTPIKERVVE